MATIDLTLNSFIVPRISTFTPPWGTVQTDPDHPGLSTQEAVNNIMMAFNRMRPIAVTEDSTTTAVDADSTLLLSGSVSSLTLGNASYKGCELKIISEAGGRVAVLDGAYTVPLEAGDTVELRWNGTNWKVKTDKHVGDFVIQHPDEKSPEEARMEGTWVPWSDRAIMYGLSTSTLPSYSKYSSDGSNPFIGSTIAAGSRPYTLYSESGGDSRLYQFIAQTAAYVVPADFDPVKWQRYDTNVTIVERQKAGNALTAADYTIGTRVTSGTYANRYVTEIIVPGGKFWGVTGGNRPTFVSGGVQGSRIKNFTGKFTYNNDAVPSPIVDGNLFYQDSTLYCSTWSNASTGNYSIRVGFDPSRVVPTGADNAGTNLSTRFWRRVS
jgi:hypothetical protein